MLLSDFECLLLFFFFYNGKILLQVSEKYSSCRQMFSVKQNVVFSVVHHPDLEKVFECEFFFREALFIAL